MSAEHSRKVVRSYRLVFRRRWRIFRLQNWRIPLPSGLELRALGYWLAALAGVVVLGRLPVLGTLLGAVPESARLLAVPIAAAWALSKWEIDGRSPHRALLGLLGYLVRPRTLASLRRCPPPGSGFVPLERLALAPDLRDGSYPRGQIRGPARLLLRYSVHVSLDGVPRSAGADAAARQAAARRWQIRPAGGPPLHKGKVLEVPAGRTVVFEAGGR
ncbi:MAG TPA: TcpE family conjugal transfer membrane protein [Solirubrobacterales bacterium]|nr:TcpE family conjugal transfer membrane protein [Solirubrobacterales bacterium]